MKQAEPAARALAAGHDTPISASEVRLGPLEDLLPFHLRLAQNASFRAFARRVGASTLRPGWYATLMLIRHNPGITQKALSHASGRDTSSLTPVIRDLERQGLIERRQVPSDRRSYTLSLTREGERRLVEMMKHAQAHDRQMDAIVGEHKQEFLEILKRLTAALS